MRAFTREELRLVLNIHGRWVDMLNRCRLPSNKNYRNYGERGIRVCDEWQGGKDGFFKFFEYVSNLPHFGEEGYTLDRIDVNGNYEPSNVRWATAKTQARNRRKTIFVTDLDGNEISLNAAAEKYGLSKGCLYSRYKFGYRGEKLFRPTFEPFLFNGKTLHELAITTGLNENTIRNRYNKGWRGDELIQPAIKLKRKYKPTSSRTDLSRQG